MRELLLMSLLAISFGVVSGADLRLEVYVSGVTPQIDAAALVRGEAKASELLGQNGIEVKWLRGRPRSCESGDRQIRLVLEVLTTTPQSASPTALASTVPERCPATGIRLFWERVSQLPQPSAVLGFVLAHELIHALPGSPRHEEDGLMKAVWNRQDLRKMRTEEGNSARLFTYPPASE